MFSVNSPKVLDQGTYRIQKGIDEVVSAFSLSPTQTQTWLAWHRSHFFVDYRAVRS